MTDIIHSTSAEYLRYSNTLRIHTHCGALIGVFNKDKIPAYAVRFSDEDELEPCIRIKKEEVTCVACSLLLFAEGAHNAS